MAFHSVLNTMLLTFIDYNVLVKLSGSKPLTSPIFSQTELEEIRWLYEFLSKTTAAFMEKRRHICQFVSVYDLVRDLAIKGHLLKR